MRAVLIAAAAWCAIAAAPALARDGERAPAPRELAAAGTVQVAFPPWDDAEGLVVAAIDAARRQIRVQTFTFSNRAIARALVAARQRGVDVAVTADRGQVYGAGFTRIPELARAGIPVWLEVRYAAAHSKVMVIDADTRESVLITGSFNWTSAAQRKNAENLLIVRRNRDLALEYLANWERRRAQALPYGRPAR
ncbi:MAG: phospholipase D family protein [Burkholderiales bacterium]|nr:phospholipase D family protein [Burkholderiales bacterium]